MRISRLPRQLEALARMLTYMLGHRPDEFGLVLSAEGFVPIKHLLQALVGEPGWGFVRRRHLEEVVGLLQPPRFEVVGEDIRCLEPGPPDLRRPPGERLPPLLYVAVPPKAHPRVWETGLKPLPDRDLVLAATPETALKLGRRRAPDPVLVTVQSQAAAKRGIPFQGYGDQLFLSPGPLPRDLLQLPPPPQIKEKPRPEKTLRPPQPPGAIIMELPQLLQDTARIKGKGRKREPAWKAGARKLRQKRRREE